MERNSSSGFIYLKDTGGLLSFGFLFVFLVEVSMSGPGFLAPADPVTVNKTTTGWVSSWDSVKFTILGLNEDPQKTTSILFVHSQSPYNIITGIFVHVLVPWPTYINRPCFSWSSREVAALLGM